MELEFLVPPQFYTDIKEPHDRTISIISTTVFVVLTHINIIPIKILQKTAYSNPD